MDEKKSLNQFLSSPASHPVKVGLLLVFIMATGIWVSGHVTNRSFTPIFNNAQAGGGTQEDPTKTYVHLELLNTQAENRIGGQPYIYILPTNYDTDPTVTTTIQNHLEHAMDVGQARALQDQVHFPYDYYSTGANGVINTFTYISMRNLPATSKATVEAWLLNVATTWTPNPDVAYDTNAAAQKIAWLGSNAAAIHADCSDNIDNDSDGLNNYPDDLGCTALDDVNENDAMSTDTTPPVFSAISAAPTQTSVTITWTTDEVSSSQVDYGPTNYYGSTAAESDTTTRVTSHMVTISGLTANTIYHYRVKSTDASNNLGTSVDQVFTTLASAGLTAPTITGSIPASNSSSSTTPSIIGTATDGSSVVLYTDAHCTGTVAGTGSSATFASPGISVTVLPGSTNAFYATATLAGQTSTCSARYTYKVRP